MQLPEPAPHDGASAKPEDMTREVVVKADGSALVQLGQPGHGEIWYVERMVVQAPDSAAGTCKAFVYAGNVEPAGLLDASADASLDVADNSRAWLVDAVPLVVVFAGAVPGKLVHVRAQVMRVRS